MYNESNTKFIKGNMTNYKRNTKGQKTAKFKTKNIIFTVITTAYTRRSKIDEMVL